MRDRNRPLREDANQAAGRDVVTHEAALERPETAAMDDGLAREGHVVAPDPAARGHLRRCPAALQAKHGRRAAEDDPVVASEVRGRARRALQRDIRWGRVQLQLAGRELAHRGRRALERLGQFRRFSVDLALDEEDLPRSSAAVTIEAASIETGAEQRDADLRSPNFLDAERFPTLTFRSRRIERAANDGYRVIGDLTIRDVTREVTLDAEFGGTVVDPWGNRRAGFTARTSIQRSDFGIVWNQLLETGGVMVSDRVDIAIELEAVAQAARAVA